MNKLLFATSNLNKKKEVEAILDSSISIYSLKDLNDFEEIEEDGLTFIDNALIKAKHYSIKHNLPAIADDSGIVIEALGGRPGVYSRRYSGKGDLENNKLVLAEMTSKTNRNAHFVSAVVLYFPNGLYYAYEGKLFGEISNEMKGTNGFGYDSILYLKEYNKCVAELETSTKNKISHRAQAIANIRRHIDEIVNYK